MRWHYRFFLACFWVGPLWAASFQQPLAFVGRDHVDLHWTPQTSYDFYRVYRDGTAVSPDLEATTDFYRDTDLNEGVTYNYQVGAYRNDGGEKWSFAQSTVAGEVRGTLYRDRSWDSGVYTLSYDVRVAPGVTLRIQEGALVKRLLAGGTALRITDEPGGTILIAGGTIEVPVDFLQSASACNQTTFQYPGGLSLRGHSGSLSLTQNRFFNLAYLTINGSAPVKLFGNEFSGALLSGAVQAELELTNNDFIQTRLELQDQCQATLAGNRFVDSKLILTTSRPVLIRRNEFLLEAWDYAQQGDPQFVYVDSSPATLEENQCSVASSFGSPTGTAFNLGGSAAVTVTVTGNLLSGFATAIRGWGTVTLDLVGNKIRDNATGIYLHGDPIVTLAGNCIAGNGPGSTERARGGLITFARTLPLTAQGDFWGDPTGPTHPTHPAGRGDAIKEWDANWNPGPTVVDFGAFTSEDNCASSIVPADLTVVELAMIQVIEGIPELVQAKPMAVKAVVASSQATGPFGIQLEFEGATYREFYELCPENLDRELHLRNASPTLQFSRAGEKTIYFFPAELPFDLEHGATVTLRLDPEQRVIDPNESNNTARTTQPVVQTRWCDDPDYDYPQALVVGVSFRGQPRNAGWWARFLGLFERAHAFLPLAGIDYQYRFDLDDKDYFQQPKDWILTDYLKFPWFRAQKTSWPLLNRWVLIYYRELINPGASPLIELSNPPSLIELKFDRTREEPSESFAVGVRSLLRTYDVPGAEVRIPVAGGLDVTERRLLDHDLAQELYGRQVYSLMGAVDPDQWCWLDRSAYETLLRKRMSTPRRSPLQPLNGPTQYPIAIVTGRVNRAGHGELDPLILLPHGLPEPPTAGEYGLRVRDATGQVIADWAFQPDFAILGPEGPMETSFGSFHFALPWPANAAELTLTHAEVLLDRIGASAHPPEVRLLFPNGGETLQGTQTVSWSGQDADGDALTYGLFFSADDGLTWRPLAIDAVESSFEWDTSAQEGGPLCRLKVMAFDGFHTCEDSSDRLFTVVPDSPRVWITAPIANALLRAGEPFLFQGFGLAHDDRRLPEPAFRWTSNLDGALGSGSTGLFTLSPGDHLITLTGTNSNGQSTETQIIVHAQSWVLPDAAFNRAGFRLPVNPEAGVPSKLTIRVENFGSACTANLAMHVNGLETRALPLELRAYQAHEVSIPWQPLEPGSYHLDFRLRDVFPADALSANNSADTWITVLPPEPGQEYDSDQDGLPNWWEAFYFNDALAVNSHDDDDQDGLSNAAEYGSGTDPTDPHSALRIETLYLDSAGQLHLHWRSLPGRIYRLLQSAELLGPVVATDLHQADGTLAHGSVARPETGSRFYRIQHVDGNSPAVRVP